MFIGQLIFDGFAMGLVFVILAAGMVLILGVNKILFMAYGMFLTIGAYLTWYFVHYWHLPYFGGLLLGVICAGILGGLSYVLIFSRLRDIETGFLSSLIASLGLQMVLAQAALLIFGTVPRSLPSVFSGTTQIGEIYISTDKLVLIITGILVCVSLFFVYEKTRIGRSMRAVSFVPEAALLQGINPNMVCLLTMVLACGIAGASGGLLAPVYGINPNMGNNIIWTVMMMIMLGGLDSLIGAVIGGIVIGQLLSFGQFYIGSTIKLILFVIIFIILFFRPNGLLGRGIDIGV